MSTASIYNIKKTLVLSLSLALLSLSFVNSSFAGPGTLDRTFDRDGKVTTSSSGVAQDIAVQIDGKIVAAGRSYRSDVLVARYYPDGSLDTSFGGSGIVETDFNGADDSGKAIAIQSDGKIVVAGSRILLNSSTGAQTADVLVVRYLANGSLDSGFGDGGQVTTDMNGGYDTSDNVVIQSDGKIVVLSSNFVARYLGNGNLDTSFGAGGIASNGTYVNDPCCSFNSAFPDSFGPDSIALQGDKIVLGGRASTSLAAVRLNSNGSVDATFGVNGIAKVPFTFFQGFMNHDEPVVIQPDQKIIVGGVDSNGQLKAVRFSASGQIDTTFGSAGTASVTSNYPIELHDLVIGKDGRVLLGGTIHLPSKFKTLVNTTPSTQLDFAVVRLNSNGSMDTTFGTKGIVNTDFADSSAASDSFDRGAALAVQSDGKVVLGGSVDSVNGIGLARYLAQ